jgi:hypothetical protein
VGGGAELFSINGRDGQVGEQLVSERRGDKGFEAFGGRGSDGVVEGGQGSSPAMARHEFALRRSRANAVYGGSSYPAR